MEKVLPVMNFIIKNRHVIGTIIGGLLTLAGYGDAFNGATS